MVGDLFRKDLHKDVDVYQRPKELSPAEIDTDVENGLEDTGRGKGKLGQSGRVAWTYIHYQM